MKEQGYTLIECIVAMSLILLLTTTIFAGSKMVQEATLHSTVTEVEQALTYASQAAEQSGRCYNIYCFPNRIIIKAGIGGEIRKVWLGKGIEIPLGITGSHMIFDGSLAGKALGTITLVHEGLGKRVDITTMIGTSRIRTKYRTL